MSATKVKRGKGLEPLIETLKRRGRASAVSAPSPAAASGTELEMILAAVLAFRQGDTTVRLPPSWTGLHGKIADALNDVFAMKERRMREAARVSHVVGREGRLKQRLHDTGLVGGWADEVEALNALLDDLVRPYTEIIRTIGAVAKGDLSQAVPLEVDGRPLEGEFLFSAKLVNRLIDYLSVFTSEVSRVARETGEGKLGGQAQVRGVSGVWREVTESVNQLTGNFTVHLRNLGEVASAVAAGDLSKKVTTDMRGELLTIREGMNALVDRLRAAEAAATNPPAPAGEIALLREGLRALDQQLQELAKKSQNSPPAVAASMSNAPAAGTTEISVPVTFTFKTSAPVALADKPLVIPSSVAAPIPLLDPAPAAAEEPAPEPFDPVEAGAKLVCEMQAAEGGAWTGEELERKFNLSSANLHKRRAECRIIYWRDARHRFHYPRWQFTPSGAILKGVQEVLEVLASEDEWRVMRYFLAPRAQLGGRHPLDLLRDGEIETVVSHAQHHVEENSW
jgi:HAMP domain-containing protein